MRRTLDPQLRLKQIDIEQVELDLDDPGEMAKVTVLNVPSILAQMDGDRVGSAEMRLDGGPHGVGLVGPPGLADRGHVVDVDAQLSHTTKRRPPRGG